MQFLHFRIRLNILLHRRHLKAVTYQGKYEADR